MRKNWVFRRWFDLDTSLLFACICGWIWVVGWVLRVLCFYRNAGEAHVGFEAILVDATSRENYGSGNLGHVNSLPFCWLSLSICIVFSIQYPIYVPITSYFRASLCIFCLIQGQLKAYNDWNHKVFKWVHFYHYCRMSIFFRVSLFHQYEHLKRVCL